MNNYKKYEGSIYTQNDIDNILDKGAQNFTESDIAILTSFATGDERIKELVEIIKSYTAKFKILNAKMEEESKKIGGKKPDKLFDQWMDLHIELSKYEHELEHKFQVADSNYRLDRLDKLRGLNESFKFFNSNDKLKGISTQPKFKIGDVLVFKPDAISIHFDNLPYVDDEYTRNWMIKNKGSKLMINGFACEEALNLWLLDVYVENSTNSYFINQDSFTFYGPNYRPRKIDRTLEANSAQYTIADKDDVQDLIKKKLSYSKYNPIVVRIKTLQDKKQFFDIISWYGVFPKYFRNSFRTKVDYIIFLKETEGSSTVPFTVKFTNDFDWYDSGELVADCPNVYPKLITPDELIDVMEDLLGIPSSKAMYTPRKIVRTLESKSVYPYRVKTDQELTKEFGWNWRRTVCRDIGWNWGMDHLLGMEYPVMDFKKEDHKDDEWIDMDINPNMSWVIMPKLLTRNVPTYTPRKINRTLESRNMIDKYKHLIFEIKTMDEFRKAQEELIKQDYIWITDSRRVQDSSRGENYPLYIFVNGDTVRYHKRRFFYECINLLEEGNLQRTIVRRQEGSSTEDICPKIFGINNISNVNKLFSYQLEPSYIPRKIVRTLEAFDSKEVFQSNLTDGKYGAICFRINTPEENTRGHRYMKELGFIRNLDRFYTNSNVLVFFTVTNSDFNTFKLLTAGSGEQIKDGSLARGYSFELSPIFTVDEMIEYMESHRNMAVNMYKPRKINRTLEAVNQSDIKYMVVCENRTDSLKFEDLLVKAGYRWGETRTLGYVLEEYPTIESVGFCEFNTENKSFTGFEYDKVKSDSTWLREYGDYTIINYPKDVQTVLSLEKKLRNMPTYEPRKIKRTLEANDFEQNLIKKIQSVLTKDLLVPEWAKKLEQGKHHPFAGHCYAASEALYHLLGGKEKGYKPMRGKGLNNETHWWIVDKYGNKLDPTAEQFYFVGLEPPYEAGKGSGFLTKNPSKRAKEIISRIQNI